MNFGVANPRPYAPSGSRDSGQAANTRKVSSTSPVFVRLADYTGLIPPRQWRLVADLGFATEFKYDNRVKNTETQSGEHEAAVIRAFVQHDKQERFLGFLANPKTRKKFTGSLSHFHWFDARYATPIPWKVDPKLKLWERRVQGIENIQRLLTSKGAGPTCWVISENSEIDGRELDLSAALRHVKGREMGTILSCVPGKLAYFESEDETLLLAR